MAVAACVGRPNVIVAAVVAVLAVIRCVLEIATGMAAFAGRLCVPAFKRKARLEMIKRFVELARAGVRRSLLISRWCGTPENAAGH